MMNACDEYKDNATIPQLRLYIGTILIVKRYIYVCMYIYTWSICIQLKVIPGKYAFYEHANPGTFKK